MRLDNGNPHGFCSGKGGRADVLTIRHFVAACNVISSVSPTARDFGSDSSRFRELLLRCQAIHELLSNLNDSSTPFIGYERPDTSATGSSEKPELTIRRAALKEI